MVDKKRFANTLLLLVLSVLGALAVARALHKPTPIHLAETAGMPVAAEQHGKAWFWIERPNRSKARLLRATRSGIETIASADAIVGYAVDEDKGQIAWAACDDKQWRVMAGPISGPKRAVWTGASEVGSPGIRGSRVVWAVPHPGLLAKAGPCVALGPSVQILMDVDGQTKPLATLFEANAHVIYLFESRAYLAAERNRFSDTTILYEVTLPDGKWRRVWGEQGLSAPIARPDGTLLWVARSQDSSNRGEEGSIRSLAPDAVVATRADWLPPEGRLFATESEIYYIDNGLRPAAWQIRSNAELVTPITLPAEYIPIAVGRDEFLLRAGKNAGAVQHLYVLPR